MLPSWLQQRVIGQLGRLLMWHRAVVVTVTMYTSRRVNVALDPNPRAD